MNVNEKKLKKLISYATTECYYCPLYGGSLNSCNRGNESCEKFMLEWLKEFDVEEALEAGAHIVNGRAIFPPEEIPVEPEWDVPCERRGARGKPSAECDFCPLAFECPYGWGDQECPFNDETCFNYESTDPCLNCPYAE